MIWRFIDSGENTGEYNMDFDIALARNLKEDEAVFRLYRWKPFCISLGANQSFNEIDVERSIKDGLHIVKRPTGGRAILHSEELTYSAAIPINYSSNLKEIYEKISCALIKGLEYYDPIFKNTELEKIQPDFYNLLKEPSGALCFASSAKNEVKFNGKKIIGSAQRRMEKSILQHGSILCGDFHERIADYLNISVEVRGSLSKEIKNKTIDIKSATKREVDYEALTKAVIKGFEDVWNVKLKF